MRLVTLVLACFGPASASASYECPHFEGLECAGHGSCTRAQGGAVCLCDEGYGRSDCAMAEGCVNNCGGESRGQCIQPTAARRREDPLVTGWCACHLGFVGSSCSEVAQSAQRVTRARSEAGTAVSIECEASCSGHGSCVCQPAKVINMTERVRVFDARGRAGQDKLVTQEVRVDAHGVKTEAFVTCSCSCHRGFTGDTCAQAHALTGCPFACSGHGHCGVDGACSCDAGYTGEGCHLVSSICPASCSGHGICHTINGSASGQCSCAHGFTGASCATYSPEAPPPMLIAATTAAALSSVDEAANTTNLIAAAASNVTNLTASAAAAAHASASASASAPTSPAAKSAGAAAAASVRAEASAESSAWSASWPQYGFVAKAAQAAAEAVRHELGAGAEQVADRCPEGCSGRGLCSPSGLCSCADGFTGAACHLATFACEANCSGHGHCERGTCVCSDDAFGPLCNQVSIVKTLSTDEAAHGIKSHAFSVGGRASGVGVNCDADCSGHGTCLGTSGTCACDAGFSHSNCATLSHERTCAGRLNMCSGKGLCLPLAAPRPRGREATPQLALKKSKNFVSRLLTRLGGHLVGGDALDTADAPAPQPAASKYACHCEPGYGGADCSQPMFTCLSNCSGRGFCTAVPFGPSGAGVPTHVGERTTRPAAPMCICERGYSGAGCEHASATCTNACSGRGTCKRQLVGHVSTAECLCAAGFTGAACDMSCPLACSGQGRCIAQASGLACLCEAGRSGEACEVAA